MGSGLSSSLFLLLPIFFLLALRILLLLVSTSTLAFCLNSPAQTGSFCQSFWLDEASERATINTLLSSLCWSDQAGRYRPGTQWGVWQDLPLGCPGSVNSYFPTPIVRSICSPWAESVVGGPLVAGALLGRAADGWAGGGGGSRGPAMWPLPTAVGPGRATCPTPGKVDTARG